MKTTTKIVLFDGICNLCNRLVIFIIKQDADAKISFASIQSHAGETLLNKYKISNSEFDTIVLICGKVAYTKSDALLRIFKIIGGFWKFFYIFIIVPKPLRDWVYIKISHNRYKLFGKRNACMIPSEKIKDRFII